jgi:hypothetical protein
MRALPVYQVTFRRQLVSKAVLFALQDFTAHLVECRLQSHVQNSLFANQVAWCQPSVPMATFVRQQLQLRKQLPLFVQQVNSVFKV